MSNKVNGKDLVIGAVVGGVLGAVAGLLFAPKPGRELRADISEQAGKITDKTVEVAQTVGSKSQELAHAVSVRTTELAGRVKEAAGTVAGEVRSWRNGRKGLPEELQEEEIILESAELPEERKEYVQI